MKKRLFSILLALCMVLCLVPITAFAEDNTEGKPPVCTCETACTEETMNTECPVCGAEGALAENCGKYVEPAAEGEASQPEGEKTQEKQESDMPKIQSEAALAQMSGEGENGIAVQNTGIAINPTNFPDVNFRSFVAEKYDTDGDEYLSNTEIAAVTELNCYNRGISDLTGIGHFTALTKLSCNENQLTSLDVSKNSALTYLSCYGNQLTVLDVSKNTSLTKLFCDSNQLTSLDVSKNTALNILWCNDNQLTSLDVSCNTALEHLDCKNNHLMTLNVSNTALGNMNCSNNQLTSLDLSKNYKDIGYDCNNNIYQIALDENRTFDLSTLPGTFDVSKTRNWNGGSVSGNILTVDDDTNIVTYTYDCGNSQNPTFTLKCTQAIRGLGMYVNGEQFTTEKLSIACGECGYMDSLCSHHAEIQYLYLIYTVYNVIILPFHSCKKKREPFTALFHIDFLIHLSYLTVWQPMSLNFFPKMGQSLVLHQMPSQLLSFAHILLQIPMQIHNSKHLSE